MLYLKILMAEAIIFLAAGIIYSILKNKRQAALEQTYREQWNYDLPHMEIELCGTEKDDNSEKTIREAIESAQLPNNIRVKYYGKE